MLTEFVSASVRVIRPKLFPPKFVSGTPSISFGDFPSTNDCGVKRPLSIAAVAVTTLKVEPGG